MNIHEGCREEALNTGHFVKRMEATSMVNSNVTSDGS